MSYIGNLPNMQFYPYILYMNVMWTQPKSFNPIWPNLFKNRFGIELKDINCQDFICNSRYCFFVVKYYLLKTAISDLFTESESVQQFLRYIIKRYNSLYTQDLIICVWVFHVNTPNRLEPNWFRIDLKSHRNIVDHNTEFKQF